MKTEIEKTNTKTKKVIDLEALQKLFDPSDELMAFELAIFDAAKKWTTQRNLVASQKTQISHLAQDLGIISPGKKDENGRRATVSIKLDDVAGSMLEGPFLGIIAMEKITEQLKRQAEKAVLAHPIGEWVKGVQAVSGNMVAEMMLLTGHLYLIPSPQKLYKKLGLDVRDGRAPRREKGQYLGFNIKAKGWAFNASEGFVKNRRSPYRAFYDRKKEEYLARSPRGKSECRFGQEHKNRDGKIVKCPPLLHVERAARRYAVKKFVKDVWLAYHKRVGTPYPELREAELRERYGIVIDHAEGETRGV